MRRSRRRAEEARRSPCSRATSRADQVHGYRYPAPHLRRPAQVPERPVEAGSQGPVQPDLHGRAGTETRAAPLVWDPDQVADSLDFTADDGWHFYGGSCCCEGSAAASMRARRRDVDTARAAVTVNVALVQVGGRLLGPTEVEGRRARRGPGQRQRGRREDAPDTAQARAPGGRGSLDGFRPHVHRRTRRPALRPSRPLPVRRSGAAERVLPGQSGGRGIRTHGDVAATMVFKTIAIGH